MAHVAAHMALKGAFHALPKLHWHNGIAYAPLGVGVACAAVFVIFHCFGAAIMSALTGFVISRALMP
jgi:hypothetical protein